MTCTDNRDLNEKLEGGIRDLARAAAIIHEMVFNQGDEEHIMWMADKLLEDTGKLVTVFDESCRVGVSA